jgi:hypothetical protein
VISLLNSELDQTYTIRIYTTHMYCMRFHYIDSCSICFQFHEMMGDEKNISAVAAALGTMLLRGFTFTYPLYVCKHFFIQSLQRTFNHMRGFLLSCDRFRSRALTRPISLYAADCGLTVCEDNEDCYRSMATCGG